MSLVVVDTDVASTLLRRRTPDTLARQLTGHTIAVTFVNTRLTGSGVHRVDRRCTQSARSAFWETSNAVFPSTPAVERPALTSATRRTLNNAFARDRSISFCKLWSFLRSSSRVAVKMRRHKRPTSSSACRPQDQPQ